jgi:hypothetical protein
MSKLQDEQNVRALFLQCVWLEQSGLTAAGRAEVEGLLQPKIRYLLQFLAVKLAARPPAGRWIAEAAAPGYLLRDGAGLKVHVPVHLFDDVPDDDVLEELLRLGATIRTGGGALCLSGSSAVYGALEHIGDCDFCEYLDGDAADDLRYAADRVCAVSSPDVVPLAITGSVGGTKWKIQRPWPTPVLTDDRAAGADALKGHYFGNTGFTGALEVTKLMLPRRSWTQSHPAQELPMEWVPRTLDEPREIQRYVAFLTRAVRDYAHKNPIKGIKRAFSLARVLFLRKEANDFLKIVRKTNVVLRAAAAARAEYARDLKTNYGEVPDDVCDHAVATAAVLFGRCVTVRAGESLSPDAMLAALEALPDEAGAAVSTLLERFVEDVDAQIAQAVH